jgi:hypothetical protein
MNVTLTPLLGLFAGGLLAVLIAIGTIVLSDRKVGSAELAAALCGGFAAFTAGVIYAEGALLWVTNHTANMWGVQVWWDLLIAVTIGLFLIAPRARTVGMNLPLWVLLVVVTASVGLLAMLARLFWLERAHATEAATENTATAPTTGAATAF